MIRFIESVLFSFRKCFSRNGCFKWFVIIVTALMLRGDKLGVTSFIRDLDLSHKCYENLLHFFHSGSYLLSSLRAQWYRIVLKKAPIYKVEGRSILIGDGVKQSKEALRMPGVKKMVQESETSSKPEYIHGHLFGVIGIIISGWNSKFCLPLKSNIQDGLKAMASWPESKGIVDISDKSHVEQIVEAGFEVAKVIGKSFLVLDRYFLSRSALELQDRQNRSLGTSDEQSVVIVTKAKANCTAYRHPRRKAGKKGRPPKKGKSVKLISLFTQKRFFKEATVKLYGNEESVSYYCLNLLWGQGLYRELRFVLVKYHGKYSILVSTDTTLDPLTIIGLYGTRFSILYEPCPYTNYCSKNVINIGIPAAESSYKNLTPIQVFLLFHPHHQATKALHLVWIPFDGWLSPLTVPAMATYSDLLWFSYQHVQGRQILPLDRPRLDRARFRVCA